MATSELSDDSVVVIVGSGAGGGTLGNELAQKGIKVVMLEAGKHESIDTFQNDEGQLPADLVAGQAHDFRQLARRTRLRHRVGLDLQDRRGHHHPLGRCFCASRSMSSRPGRPTAISPGEPVRLAGDAGRAGTLLCQGRGQDGVTRTNGIPGLPGNNNFKVFFGAKRLGYKEVNTGHMAINSQPRDRHSRRCRSASASRAASPRRPSTPRSCGPENGQSGVGRSARRCRCSMTMPQGTVSSTPTRTAAQQVQREGLARLPATPSRARPAAELGLGQVPGRPRQLLGQVGGTICGT